MAKNIIILSEKSSGSSALQNLLAEFADIRHVSTTRHFESETLYWIKAASILGKPQLEMVDSEVPIKPKKARADLVRLLRDNLEDYTLPEEDKKLVTQGWKRLCKRYSPIFVEKSPHHLCQWSAIELIVEHIHKVDDVDFLLIGLIRNPMATMYSQYRRWASPPERVERQWLVAYRNLQRLKAIMGDQLVIVRYKDIVSSLECLEPVFGFCGVTPSADAETYLHNEALGKWKHDRLFGFSLSDQTIELAEKYGYQRSELVNESYPLWGIVSKLWRLMYVLTLPMRNIARNVLWKIDSRG
jgi:hypothetical protein